MSVAPARAGARGPGSNAAPTIVGVTVVTIPWGTRASGNIPPAHVAEFANRATVITDPLRLRHVSDRMRHARAAPLPRSEDFRMVVSVAFDDGAATSLTIARDCAFMRASGTARGLLKVAPGAAPVFEVDAELFRELTCHLPPEELRWIRESKCGRLLAPESK